MSAKPDHQRDNHCHLQAVLNNVSDDDYMDDTDGDPSYIPSETEYDSGNEDLFVESKRKDNFKEDSTVCNKKRKVTSSEAAVLSSSGAPEVLVLAAGSKDGKRVYDKRQACFYCGGLFSKISSHLQNIHSSEAEVCRILAKPKKSIERKNGWQKLRNRGNFEHNVKALIKGENIIVDRRPSKDRAVDDFLPCPYCLAFVVKDDLWRHTKICPFLDTERDEKSVKKTATLLLNGSVSTSEVEKEFLPISHGMKNDEITSVIKSDKLIVRLGSDLMKKGGKDRIANVRQKVRELGRLLLVLKSEKPNFTSYNDFIKPGLFDTVVQGVKKLCNSEYGETYRGCEKYELPSLALKLGHSLKKLAQIKVGQALRKQDEKEQKDAENYITLHENEWTDRVSSQAMSTLSERKFNNTEMLPLTEDIVQLRTYLLKEMPKKIDYLKQFPDRGTWKQLAVLVLCRVCIFNRRRGGEVGAMLLESYTGRSTGSGCKEITSSLEPIEQKLMERLELVEILGKKKQTSTCHIDSRYG